MKDLAQRTVKASFAMIIFAVGIYLTIMANVGLAPWDAFSMGLTNVTPFSYGDIVVIVGVLVVVADILLKEKIGIGTIVDIAIIGKTVDLFIYLDIVPMQTELWKGVLMLIAGEFVICFASVIYMGAGLGCGPRDALMMGLARRLPKVPIGAVRGLIEGTVLLIGFLLGGKVGIGTVIAVFGLGTAMQITFTLCRFDAKGVKHESLVDNAILVRDIIREKKNKKETCAVDETCRCVMQEEILHKDEVHRTSGSEILPRTEEYSADVETSHGSEISTT